MFLHRQLRGFLPRLLAGEHPTLAAIREAASKGKVYTELHTFRTRGIPPLNRNEMALWFGYNSKKVPILPTAPTDDFPLASLVAEGRPDIATRMFVVDGWLWRLLFTANGPQFPRFSLFKYQVSNNWESNDLPLWKPRDYSDLNAPIHKWLRKKIEDLPNGNPGQQLHLYGCGNVVRQLFQMFSTVQIGGWTWSVPGDDDLIEIDGHEYIPVARDDCGNFRAVRIGSSNIWNLCHDPIDCTDLGDDLQAILECDQKRS